MPRQPDADWMTGAGLIATERRRQVEVEGFTVEHDAEQSDNQLLAAAWCYLGRLIPHRLRQPPALAVHAPLAWPWAPTEWKPTVDDPVRQLVKAGALIAAEIDRLLAEGVAT